MKRCLVICVLALLLVSAASAQTGSTEEPCTREDVIKLFDVMQIRQQMELVTTQIFQQMREMSREEMKDRKIQVTPADVAKVDALSDRIMKEISVSDMLDDMIPVYQKHLSKSH